VTTTGVSRNCCVALGVDRNNWLLMKAFCAKSSYRMCDLLEVFALCDLDRAHRHRFALVSNAWVQRSVSATDEFFDSGKSGVTGLV